MKSRLQKLMVVMIVVMMGTSFFLYAEEIQPQEGEELYLAAEALFNKIAKMEWQESNLVKYDEVIKKAQEIIDKYPGREIALKAQHLIARSYEKQVDYPQRNKALCAYINMISKYRSNKEAAVTTKDIADEYIKIGYLPYAAKFYRKYLEIIRKYQEESKAREAIKEVADIFLNAEGYNYAREFYDKYLVTVKRFSSEEDMPKILKDIADNFFRGEGTLYAIKLYKKILLKYPQCEGADYIHYRLGLYSEGKGNWRETIKEYQILSINYPQSTWIGEAQRRLIDLYFGNSDIGALQNFLKDYPKSKLSDDVLCYIGIIYYRQKQYRLSRINFRKILTKYPNTNSKHKAREYLKKLRR